LHLTLYANFKRSKTLYRTTKCRGKKVISPDAEFKKNVSLTSSGKREENAVRMSAMERCSKKKYIRVNFCFRPMIATMLQPLL
jgi:hypothetical protein